MIRYDRKSQYDSILQQANELEKGGVLHVKFSGKKEQAGHIRKMLKKRYPLREFLVRSWTENGKLLGTIKKVS